MIMGLPSFYDGMPDRKSPTLAGRRNFGLGGAGCGLAGRGGRAAWCRSVPAAPMRRMLVITHDRPDPADIGPEPLTLPSNLIDVGKPHRQEAVRGVLSHLGTGSGCENYRGRQRSIQPSNLLRGGLTGRPDHDPVRPQPGWTTPSNRRAARWPN